MCAGFLAPLLKFWVVAFGTLSAMSLAVVAAAFVASAAVWWLPDAWYRTRHFERSGRLYERVGVRLFRRVVPNGDWVNAWRRRHDQSFRVIARRADLAQLRQRTVVGEKSHLVLFGIAVASASYAWWIGWNGWAAYLAIANVFANVYPILLQRYTRARMQRAGAGAA